MKFRSKKEKDTIYKNRKNIYEELFIKYDYLKKDYLNEIYLLYYNNYIKKGIPRIDIIEDEIKFYIKKITLKDDLLYELNKRNIDYYETKEVSYYLHRFNKKYSLALFLFGINDKYNIEYAIESLNKRMIKENIYKSLNKFEYNTLAYKYINDSDKDINDFIKIINTLEIIKKYIENDLDLVKICDNNINVINFIIDNIIKKWCDVNKNNNIESFDFIKNLDNVYQTKIKKCFLMFEEIKQTELKKKIIRENTKKSIKYNNDLLCSCNNIASIKCINFLCKCCCNSIDCKRHYNN
jgi:hypothetical protein